MAMAMSICEVVAVLFGGFMVGGVMRRWWLYMSCGRARVFWSRSKLSSGGCIWVATAPTRT